MNIATSKTIQHGNFTVVIHRPELCKTERAKREKQILFVLDTTMRSYIARKEGIHT